MLHCIITPLGAACRWIVPSGRSQTPASDLLPWHRAIAALALAS